MRRSRSDAAETRERIVSTASKMFLEKGLESVGMRDIMAAAGLTPGGFYRHFESKEQLIAEANSAAFGRLLEMFEAETAGKSNAEALEIIVWRYLNQSQAEENTFRCPLSMNGGELSHCEPQVRAVALSGYQRMVELIADRITHVKRAEALAIAGGVVSTMVGSVTMANLASTKTAASAILSNAHGVIRTLLSVTGTSAKTAADGAKKLSAR
ncbi:TetR/AcrR family transcriptional regulator [Tunturiibacter gelidoferens]|jgi:TetR/AcrR family transcriptional regulator, transcriptional repressor for nem operon|uniref:TetR/AcrR family transcriptional repressor of nem operon n=1 Tax=Tunturiibacter gelidiferens TaxID=3069689 RepID=A0A9X0QA14_9BACT|nr:TetR/AcrR family transcriptional regulator [Edaphobacter lichenicola]MBB5326582.1 TetR/AcrR family transcriptional repressor of nem operon [Edaphobacter lichenicola]